MVLNDGDFHPMGSHRGQDSAIGFSRNPRGNLFMFQASNEEISQFKEVIVTPLINGYKFSMIGDANFHSILISQFKLQKTNFIGLEFWDRSR